jgi:hypothetical protein
MSEAIASGTSYAASSDITVTGGTPKSFYIHFTGSAIGVEYQLQHKSAGGAYQTLITLTPANITQFGTVSGAGVFRAIRNAGSNASSLDVE